MLIRILSLALLLFALIGCGLLRPAEAGSDKGISGPSDEAGRWKQQVSGVTNQLSDVYFSDQMNGWAVGEGGTILSTSDGGSTWRAVFA